MFKNYHIEEFNFNLPKHLIAQEPLINKDNTKMLYVNSQKNIISNNTLLDLPNFLKAGDVLVFNNTKVIKARLLGYKNSAKLNVTLHYKVNSSIWYCYIKNSKRLKVNDSIVFSNIFSAKVLEKRLEEQDIKLQFLENNEEIKSFDRFLELLDTYGFMPLPPYIKRDNTNINDTDEKNYQSIFAKEEGAVAAPTASLHFTENFIKSLEQKGINIAYITLHVGAGTFMPVKVDNILDHKMHKEWGELKEEDLEKIKNAKRVIAVGTTSLRVLEYIYKLYNKLKPFSGEIDLFITPSFEIKVAHALITNFHLPKSTLFMLVCGFLNMNIMKEAYSFAINNNYRFFSYGDFCFLER